MALGASRGSLVAMVLHEVTALLAAGLAPQGKAQPRNPSSQAQNARKLQRTLYRVAKQQPERRFTLLYDKVDKTSTYACFWLLLDLISIASRYFDPRSSFSSTQKHLDISRAHVR